jgi:AraC family transcriptional regulator
MTGAYGKGLGEHLRLDRVPALVTKTINKTTVAVTRCTLDAPTHGPTSPLPSEDAYMVVLQTGKRSHRELWLDGKPVRTQPLNPGEVTLHDLRRRPAFKMYTPIDSLNFYVPRQALDACADGAEARKIEELYFTPGAGSDEKILAALGQTLLPAFEHPDHVSRLFVEHVTWAFVFQLVHSFGAIKLHKRRMRGGLAPWQERRVKELIEAKLDGEVPLAMLAAECGLSLSHFSRAFRRSTGTSPHRWLLRRRVELAKERLRDPKLRLSEVALSCGFADQSHFTRVFNGLFGTSPGAWRRSQYH